MTHFVVMLGNGHVFGFHENEEVAREMARGLGGYVEEWEGRPPSNEQLSGRQAESDESADFEGEVLEFDSVADVVDLRPRVHASGFYSKAGSGG